MNVKLLKNIKYNGCPYKVGDNINICVDDISEFIEKKIIDEEVLEFAKDVNLEEVDEESDPTEQLIREDNSHTNTIGIDDITKADIIALLTDKGIEHNNRDKKEVLYALLLGSE